MPAASASPRLKPHDFGVILTQANALAAAANFVLAKFILGSVTPWRYSAFCYLIAALTNSLWEWLTKRGAMPRLHSAESGQQEATSFDAATWRLIALHCVFSAAGVILLWLGVERIPTHVAAILSRLEAVVGILLGLLWLGERFNSRQWWGVAVTAIGVAIIRWASLSGQPLGFILVVSAALSLGIAHVLGKLALKKVPVPQLMQIRGWVLALLLCGGWLAFEPGIPPLKPVQWLLIAASALIGPVFARNSYLLALSYLPVSQAVLLNQTQPLYAALLATIFLSELPTHMTYIGAGVIVAGVALLVAGQRVSVPVVPSEGGE